MKRMLEAFADRDLDRLVETVHPDSRWTYLGANPWNSFQNEWAQKYVVQNGLIIEMEEYNIQVKAAS